MLIFKLGFRNILRNKKRTTLSAIAIGIGLAALILTDAIIIGMNRNMIKGVTRTFMGDAQIHHKSFVKTLDVEKIIDDLPVLVRELNSDERIEGVALRTQSYAMISSAANVVNVLLYGVEPDAEKSISMLSKAIVSGSYFTDSKSILIGVKLADKLEVGVGEKIVLTLAQAGSGELSQELFRIGGIFDFGVRDMNGGMAFVPILYSQEMLNLPKAAHEIAIRFKNLNDASNLQSDFWQRYSQKDNEALGWNKLVPAVQAAIEMNEYSTAIIGLILFIVVALGIMNTLFMSIYERFYEFGVLKAIGTSPFKIWLMIMAEAVSLSILSIVLGVFLALGFGYYLSVYGLDYSGIEFASVTLNEPIRAVLTVRQFIIFPMIVSMFTTIVGIYPAIFAARIVPARAMKKTL